MNVLFVSDCVCVRESLPETDRPHSHTVGEQHIPTEKQEHAIG